MKTENTKDNGGRRREAFFEHMREVSERANVSEEEAEPLIAEAIAAVRRERRAQKAGEDGT